MILSPLLIFFFGCGKPKFEGKAQEEFEWLFKTRKVYSMMVDIRSEAAYESGHLEGAVNIPFSEHFLDELEKRANPEMGSMLLFVYGDDEASTQAALKAMKTDLAKQKTKPKVNVVYYLEGEFKL